MKLFFGADDQIEMVQHLLQLARDLVRFHKAGFSVAQRRQPPQHRAVIDVQRGAQAVAARVFQRLQHRGAGVRVRQVRAGDGQRARGGDVGLIDVVRRQRHVRAVFAVEDQREGFLVLDAEDHQAG